MENWTWDPNQGYVPIPGYQPQGYEMFRAGRNYPPWGVTPYQMYGPAGRPQRPRARGPTAPQYAIGPEALAALTMQRRTRSWLEYVLSALGLMAPGAQKPSYSPFYQPTARRPTQFFFPPYMGGY